MDVRILALAALAAATPAVSRAQEAPRFVSMTASRLLLLPAQELAGAPDPKIWLARFDSVLTARLEDGGIASGWAYPRDAARYARQNPTYASDPRAMGAQPLKNEKVDKGFTLPDPFASRLRAMLAIADARTAIVPVVARVDTTKTPRVVELQLMFIDGRLNRVLWRGKVSAEYVGGPMVAADSLAFGVARLFVAN